MCCSRGSPGFNGAKLGNSHASTTRPTVELGYADNASMGFLNYALILFVMLVALTLYVMRRRTRQGRRTPKF